MTPKSSPNPLQELDDYLYNRLRKKEKTQIESRNLTEDNLTKDQIKKFISVKTVWRLTPKEHKELIAHLAKLSKYEWVVIAETTIK